MNQAQWDHANFMAAEGRDDDLEEAHAREGLIYELSVALMRLDGNDGDPHQLVWEGGPVPEPWGDVWQKYEPDAETVLNAIGEGSARALVGLRSTLTNVQRVLEAAGHDAKGDDAACKALRLIAACGVLEVQPLPPLPEAKVLVREADEEVRSLENGGWIVDCDCEGPLSYSLEGGEALYTAEQMREYALSALGVEGRKP